MKIRFTEDELCLDCSSPYVVVNQVGELQRYYHDQTCPVLVAAKNRNQCGSNRLSAELIETELYR